MKIVLEHLTKKFHSRSKGGGDVIAVNDFDFTIPDGMLVGLLGPSGCGKSTTLNLISGLEKPTEGKIFFGEDDVTDLAPQDRGVGLVFQNYALYPHLNVEKNIRFPLENLRGEAKLSKEEMAARVSEVVKLVQIEELMERKPGGMSGGQQQRVAIARALVKRPRVMLLDEPLSNLDARLRIQIREEIKRIQRETKITTVFVTHDQDEAMSICDMIVVMKSGIMMQMGKPQDVYDDPANLFVAKFLGTPPINVFEGRIGDGRLFIGEDAILSSPDLRGERDVYVAIRPEGFRPCEDGPFRCKLERVEVMGRDVSILSRHDGTQNDTGLIRSIVDSDNRIDVTRSEVRFEVKPHKVHVFDRDTEERIRFGVADEV